MSMKTVKPLSRQKGISFLGLLILGVVLALIAIVGAKVFPTATEYIAINKAVKKAAAEGDTVQAIRLAFDRSAAVDYISSIEGKDLQVSKQNDQVVVSFAYDKEIPLAGPAFLLIKYRGSAISR